MVETTVEGRVDVTEWHPILDTSGLRVLVWAGLLAVAVVGSVRKAGRRPFAWVIMGGLAAASFRTARLGPFFATAVMMLAAPAIVGAVREPADARSAAAPAVMSMTVFATAIVVIAVAAVVSARNAACVRMTYEWGPDVEAAAFIRANDLHGRMITWYDWGEYAMWHFGPRLRVSMDARAETVYTPAPLAAHQRLYGAAPGWRDYLQSLQPDYIWLPRALPVVAALGAPDWVRIYDGASSVIFARPVAGPFVQPRVAVLPACFPADPP